MLFVAHSQTQGSEPGFLSSGAQLDPPRYGWVGMIGGSVRSDWVGYVSDGERQKLRQVKVMPVGVRFYEWGRLESGFQVDFVREEYDHPPNHPGIRVNLSRLASIKTYLRRSFSEELWLEAGLGLDSSNHMVRGSEGVMGWYSMEMLLFRRGSVGLYGSFRESLRQGRYQGQIDYVNSSTYRVEVRAGSDTRSKYWFGYEIAESSLGESSLGAELVHEAQHSLLVGYREPPSAEWGAVGFQLDLFEQHDRRGFQFSVLHQFMVKSDPDDQSRRPPLQPGRPGPDPSNSGDNP